MTPNPTFITDSVAAIAGLSAGPEPETLPPPAPSTSSSLSVCGEGRSQGKRRLLDLGRRVRRATGFTRETRNQVQESLFHKQNYVCKERRGCLDHFLSGHDPRLVREGGQECITGEGTPGPAGGSRRGNVGEGGSGFQNPLRKTVLAFATPLGREGLGPLVLV